MVMKPKLWIYCVPTRRLDTKRHHACAQRGTLIETFRYASPRMATAQRQYVYVSVSTLHELNHVIREIAGSLINPYLYPQ